MEGRPEFPEVFLRIAEVFALRSSCKRLKVGCVVTRFDMTTILGHGYNGNAMQLPNTCDSDVPGACGCIHAEANALLHAGATGPMKKIFCTYSPCVNCAKLCIQARVVEVYYRTVFRSSDGLNLLVSYGIPCIQVPPSA